APLSLNACGFSTGNNHRRDRSPAGQYTAEIVELCQHGDASAGEVAKDADAAQTAAPASADHTGRDAGTRKNGLTSADRRAVAEARRENRRRLAAVESFKRDTAIIAAGARGA